MAKWQEWAPIDGIPSKYYIAKILHNVKGFYITLKNDNNHKMVIFTFKKNYIISKKCTKRVAFLKTISDLKKKYEQDFFELWSLFKVLDSDFSKTIQEQSYGIYEISEMSHFVFLGENEVLEVLASFGPKITIKNDT